MRKYWNKAKIYNVNSIERYASGFPLDAFNNYKTVSLNGDWKFKFCGKVKEIPEGFEKPGADLSGFETKKSRPNWQIAGYDIPIYTNVRYPKAIEKAYFFPPCRASKRTKTPRVAMCAFLMSKNRRQCVY